MIDLVTLGESMALFTARRTGLLRHARDFGLGVGGAESNLAIGVSRMGRRAAWIGRVGADEFGELLRSTLAGEGVDVRGMIVDPEAPTGLMVKSRRTAELVDVRYYRSGSAGSRLRPEDLDLPVLRSARVLHVTGITLAISASAAER
ncbi:PfkB family carbohydrate kinase, partial [Streptosporangium algeriense]